MKYTSKPNNEQVDCSQCLCYYCERNKNGCKGCESCTKDTLIDTCQRFREDITLN